MKAKQKRKVANLILYLLEKNPELTYVGIALMLHNIDMQSFREFGHTITGMVYTKGFECPEPKGFWSIITYMRDKGMIETFDK